MDSRRLTLLLMLIASCSPIGCLGPRLEHYESSRAVSIADPSDEADALWDSIASTLRDHRFRLDRMDRRHGVITTHPVVSQHFFEFWRHDVDTTPDFWEASFNHMRRWVEVTVTRGEDGLWNNVLVAVHKQRFSSPDRQFNTTGAAYQYFGDRLPSTTGLVRVTAEYDVWVDDGRDPAMESYFLEAFLAPAGAGDSPEGVAEGD